MGDGMTEQEQKRFKAQNRIISAMCELEQQQDADTQKKSRHMSRKDLHRMYLQRKMEKWVIIP